MMMEKPSHAPRPQESVTRNTHTEAIQYLHDINYIVNLSQQAIMLIDYAIKIVTSTKILWVSSEYIQHC